MKGITLKIFLTLFLNCWLFSASGQLRWSSPEVERMYTSANLCAVAGNYKDAITIYKQAIRLEPSAVILYSELGEALFHIGNYGEAQQVLEKILEHHKAYPATYATLAAAQAAQNNVKGAFATLKDGIDNFPNDGILYHKKGELYINKKKKSEALNAWLDGIKSDAKYADNYRAASEIYLQSDRVLWGIIYGEQFLSMEHDTAEDDVVKRKLFVAYKTLFDNMVRDDVPEYGKEVKAATVKDFEDAVMQTYRSLTPVVSDGITTENLAMLRVRFLMLWFSDFGEKYPFSLFSYQDMLIRNGRFDVYNEWLFGKAESANEYKAWNLYHEGDMQRFLQWQQQNFYAPAGNEFYNTRNRDRIFEKNKK